MARFSFPKITAATRRLDFQRTWASSAAREPAAATANIIGTIGTLSSTSSGHTVNTPAGWCGLTDSLYFCSLTSAVASAAATAAIGVDFRINKDCTSITTNLCARIFIVFANASGTSDTTDTGTCAAAATTGSINIKIPVRGGPSSTAAATAAANTGCWIAAATAACISMAAQGIGTIAVASISGITAIGIQNTRTLYRNGCARTYSNCGARTYSSSTGKTVSAKDTVATIGRITAVQL